MFLFNWAYGYQKQESGITGGISRGSDVIAELEQHFERTGLRERAETGGYNDAMFHARLSAIMREAKRHEPGTPARVQGVGDFIEAVIFEPEFLRRRPAFKERLRDRIIRCALVQEVYYDWHYWRLFGENLREALEATASVKNEKLKIE